MVSGERAGHEIGPPTDISARKHYQDHFEHSNSNEVEYTSELKCKQRNLGKFLFNNPY